MKWYTTSSGRLCLGTDEKRQTANFHVATDLIVEHAIEQPLLPEHVALIGAFPEDWYSDELIDNKINNTAKHFFSQQALLNKEMFV